MLCLAMICAARVMHQNLLMSILKAQMSFFDTTPLGRILNRFSKDIDSIDSTMPLGVKAFLNCMVPAFSILFIVSYTTPILLVILIPILILLVSLQVIYLYNHLIETHLAQNILKFRSNTRKRNFILGRRFNYIKPLILRNSSRNCRLDI